MSILDQTDPQSGEEIDLPGSFPANFVWGAATASYQVEGAANEDGRAPSIWDMFSATPGKVHNGDTGDIAIDQYHRYLEDIELARSLGLSAYRFSVSWSRVLPQGTGTVNEAGLDYYDRLVDALLARGIQPVTTLYHWDLPLALYEKGGWVNRDTAYAYADYAEIVARRLGDRVTMWKTHNEPWCVAYLGYGVGEHAPGHQEWPVVGTVAHHVLLSHGLAVPRVRAHMRPDAQIGITLNFTPGYAADEQPATLARVEQARREDRWFTDPLFRGVYPEGLFADLNTDPPPIKDGDMAIISTPIDFLGVNNYTRTVFRASADGSRGEVLDPVPGSLYTDMHWEVYPTALRNLLVWLNQEYAPKALYVTENGAAFPDTWDGSSDVINDPLRTAYLHDHIEAVSQAMEQGVPVKGYFVWSLMDNFEWAYGYSKRFGIIYVDYPTQRRILKDSAHWYANLIRHQREQSSEH
ncbi:MAG TPA: GH1 family beta-glucosidase [Ktedonobacteraceae bacterium]|nr:GH1 family beta-glucosidase [Ktedonobacteraceae bacterium]